MNRTTISLKGLLIAGIVLATALATVVVTGLLGAPGGGPTARAQAPAVASEGEVTPTLTMSGRGTATGVPDQLSFTLTASAKRDSLEDALAAASQAMRSAQTRLAEYDIDEKDIATTGLQMNPEYNYPRNGPPELTGYRVQQKARVRVGDLSTGGEAIAAVVRSGDSTVKVGGIKLEVADTAEILAQARAAAVGEARTKAEQYAEAAGVELGSIVSLREVQRNEPEVEVDLRAAVADSESVPIMAGEQETGVTVEIVWSLSG